MRQLRASRLIRFVIGIITLTFAFSADSHAQSSRLILNEALANEPGSNTSAEWLEFINWPGVDSSWVCLDEYRIVDGADTSRYDTSVCLYPGDFLILARKPLGEGSFEAVYGNNSGVWGDDPSEQYFLLGVDISLRNSSDTVVMLSPFGDTSTIFWTTSQPDGVSLERIRPDGGDDQSNFAVCTDPSGSTPGRKNSVFPVTGDLAMDSLTVDPATPVWASPTTLEIYVTNVGFGPVMSATVDLFEDLNFSQPGTTLELIDRVVSTNPIAEGAWGNLSYAWSPRPGIHRIVARLVADGDDRNNETAIVTTVRHSQPLVLLSEFLANPTVDGPDEWIEIYNAADFPVSMRSVRIGDSTNTSAVPTLFNEFIQPGDFWVLAENETAFRNYYSKFNGQLIEIPGWNSLNNTGDRIRLIGAAGEVIDSLSFRTIYENNRSSERVDLAPVLHDERYWKGSVDPTGATPGRPNSVEPLYDDVAIDSVSDPMMTISPGYSAAYKIFVKNVGYATSSPRTLSMYRAVGVDVLNDPHELVGQAVVPSLAEAESLAVTIVWPAPFPGFHDVIFALDPDDDVRNNYGFADLVVSIPTQDLIISEFMANPTSDGPGEWFEVANVAETRISINPLKFADQTDLFGPVRQSYLAPLEAGGFVVYAQSEADFRAYYPQFAGRVYELTSWQSLNNDGDQLRIYGPDGATVDLITFTTVYDDNHSAERINQTQFPARPEDWVECVDPSGATPGKTNSVNSDNAGHFAVDIAPNPMYLSRGQSMNIGYVLEIGERLTLKIFDRAGRLVRTLADDSPAATGSVDWDGTNDNGGTVKPGPYVLYGESQPAGSTVKEVIVVGP